MSVAVVSVGRERRGDLEELAGATDLFFDALLPRKEDGRTPGSIRSVAPVIELLCIDDQHVVDERAVGRRKIDDE